MFIHYDCCKFTFTGHFDKNAIWHFRGPCGNSYKSHVFSPHIFSQLTAKNIQCMRAILSLAHCHGAILGASWHLILSTLQHLVWILGLKPTPGGGLKGKTKYGDYTNRSEVSVYMPHPKYWQE